jgi:hypothetical protein
MKPTHNVKSKYIFRVIIGLSGLFAFTSCWKEIDTVKLEPLTTITVQYNIQETQSYYKIDPNEIRLVKFNNPRDWDLAFECGANGYHVKLNNSASAQVIDAGTADFAVLNVNKVLQLIGSTDWNFDHQNGNLDSTALRNWQTNSNIYLLNRGGLFPNEVAYYKLDIVSVDLTSYTIRYADVNKPNDIITKTIAKDNTMDFVYFSFTLNDVKQIEPPKPDWDLLFTPYYGWYPTLDGAFSPYYMSGVFINFRSGVQVARIVNAKVDYKDLDSGAIDTLTFSSVQDIIGQDWKKIPSTTDPIYYMDEAKKYIIHAVDGGYYKLHFLSFYNEFGIKGFPVIEYTKIR